jgi:hypothetical protein
LEDAVTILRDKESVLWTSHFGRNFFPTNFYPKVFCKFPLTFILMKRTIFLEFYVFFKVFQRHQRL